MNYMPEVAKLLGVELGEEFHIKEQPDIKCTIYNDRLYVYPTQDKICTLPSCELTLSRLLNGHVTIKRKPWKPNEGDDFWIVDADEVVCRYCNFNSQDADYVNCYKIGNCYRTKEEAEKNVAKWAAFYKSDEVLEI